MIGLLHYYNLFPVHHNMPKAILKQSMCTLSLLKRTTEVPLQSIGVSEPAQDFILNTSNALLSAHHAVQAATQEESAAAGKGEEEAEAAGQQQGDQAQVGPLLPCLTSAPLISSHPGRGL